MRLFGASAQSIPDAKLVLDIAGQGTVLVLEERARGHGLHVEHGIDFAGGAIEPTESRADNQGEPDDHKAGIGIETDVWGVPVADEVQKRSVLEACHQAVLVRAGAAPVEIESEDIGGPWRAFDVYVDEHEAPAVGIGRGNALDRGPERGAGTSPVDTFRGSGCAGRDDEQQRDG